MEDPERTNLYGAPAAAPPPVPPVELARTIPAARVTFTRAGSRHNPFAALAAGASVLGVAGLALLLAWALGAGRTAQPSARGAGTLLLTGPPLAPTAPAPPRVSMRWIQPADPTAMTAPRGVPMPGLPAPRDMTAAPPAPYAPAPRDPTSMPPPPPARTGMFTERVSQTEMPTVTIHNSSDCGMSLVLTDPMGGRATIWVPAGGVRSQQVRPGRYEAMLLPDDNTVLSSNGDASFGRFRSYDAEVVTTSRRRYDPPDTFHLGD